VIILAIDQSTAVGSAAVLRNTDVRAECAWREQDVRNQHLFTALPHLLTRAGTELGAVDLFAVGRGPGAFSGIRISLSAVRGLALPRGKPVHALTSSEALAWDVWRESGLSPILVAGDARRDRLWAALFAASPDGIRAEQPVRLLPREQLPSLLASAAVVVTPDWDRIGELLERHAPPSVRLTPENRVPRARIVGERAWLRVQAGLHSDPLTPLYLHPSVFAEPRFVPAAPPNA